MRRLLETFQFELESLGNAVITATVWEDREGHRTMFFDRRFNHMTNDWFVPPDRLADPWDALEFAMLNFEMDYEAVVKELGTDAPDRVSSRLESR